MEWLQHALAVARVSRALLSGCNIVVAACFLLPGFLGAQEVAIFENGEEGIIVTCDIGEDSGMITGIKTLVSEYPVTEERITRVGTWEDRDLYVHIHPRDTALLYINEDDTRNYFYATLSSTESEDMESTMLCIYSGIIYPEAAREKSISGTVLLNVYLDEAGEQTRVDVKSNIGNGLEEAAIIALKECQFPDPEFGGNPVQAVYHLPVKFSLQ